MCGQTASTPAGRSRITGAIIRNNGPRFAVTRRFSTRSVGDSLFGAQFLSILDAYRYVERSIKYGVLFLVLVFTTFFLFEVTARQKIHPFQYLMVGAALCLFYLLLLSISEFLGFGYASLIAAIASTGLITWYCRFFLGGGVRTMMIGAGLAGVYGFLYITLRQQDYALLMGAIALFALLAVVICMSRGAWIGTRATRANKRRSGRHQNAGCARRKIAVELRIKKLCGG
jgi:inner membrane protein